MRTRMVCTKVTEAAQDSKLRIQIVPPRSTCQLWLVASNSSLNRFPYASCQPRDVDEYPLVMRKYLWSSRSVTFRHALPACF